jgi:hypothetical protein
MFKIEEVGNFKLQTILGTTYIDHESESKSDRNIFHVLKSNTVSNFQVLIYQKLSPSLRSMKVVFETCGLK